MNTQAESGRTKAVDHLQDLYSVVVAIALGLAVERVIVGPSSAPPTAVSPHKVLPVTASTHALFARSSIPLAVALIATLLPFYYGALRHLDAEYSPGSAREAKPYALLVDFLLLFLESCTFLALGAAVNAPRTFGWTLVALLAIDIVWAGVALKWLTKEVDVEGASSKPERPAEQGWFWINVVFGAMLVALLVATTHWSTPVNQLRWALVAMAVARTIVDVKVGWKLYTAE